jgi:hypothetical protein
MFSDQGKAQSNEDDFNKVFKKLSESWKTAEVNYKDADTYFKNYQKNVSQIATLLDDLQTFNKDETERLYVHMEESKQNSKKDGEFSDKAEQFIQSNTEELAKKIKHLDALKTKMKEVLNNLNPKKLSDLKVNESSDLKEFFSTIFEIYYKGKKEAFDWSKFKTNAIIKDKCDDLSVRLCTLDFGALTEEKLAMIEKIKSSNSINKFASEDSKGENILDLLDYFEFVPEACKTQKAIEEIEKNIKKIKSDAPVRQVRAVYLKEKAELINSDIKFLEENDKKYTKFIEEFTTHCKKFDQVSDGYKQHRSGLMKNVVEKYNQVQAVPTKIYV